VEEVHFGGVLGAMGWFGLSIVRFDQRAITHQRDRRLPVYKAERAIDSTQLFKVEVSSICAVCSRISPKDCNLGFPGP
jgi:hypothetical protein